MLKMKQCIIPKRRKNENQAKTNQLVCFFAQFFKVQSYIQGEKQEIQLGHALLNECMTC